MDKNQQLATREPWVPKPLPKIDDLYKDIELSSKHNELNRLLNCAPKKEWVKQHPMYKKEIPDGNGGKIEVPTEYLPIGVIEYLATSIFIRTWTEIKAVQHIANSIVVTVRVWVLNPVDGEWMCEDGIGAAPMRTKKGAAATDFSAVQDSAVQTGAPAAKTYAEKDAFEKFGKIFGRDLNRAEDVLLNYNNLEKKFTSAGLPEGLQEVINECESGEALASLWTANVDLQSNLKFKEALDKRKEEIANKVTPTEEA